MSKKLREFENMSFKNVCFICIQDHMSLDFKQFLNVLISKIGQTSLRTANIKSAIKKKTYLSSLCLYFIKTVPVMTSIIQIEFPPQVATLDVVFKGSKGSGSNTTSQICKVNNETHH